MRVWTKNRECKRNIKRFYQMSQKRKKMTEKNEDNYLNAKKETERK